MFSKIVAISDWLFTLRKSVFPLADITKRLSVSPWRQGTRETASSVSKRRKDVPEGAAGCYPAEAGRTDPLPVHGSSGPAWTSCSRSVLQLTEKKRDHLLLREARTALQCTDTLQLPGIHWLPEFPLSQAVSSPL